MKRGWWLVAMAAALAAIAACATGGGGYNPNPCLRTTCPVGYECKIRGVSGVCEKLPAEQPPIVVGPPVVVEPPLAPFCTQGRKQARFHPYLQGIDITWICQGDHEFCVEEGSGFWTDGTPRPRYDCAFGPDRSDIRNKREATLGCPAVFWSHTKEGPFLRCTSAPNATGMSCDKWDLHNVPPGGCAPDTGYFTIPQGKGYLQVCSLKDPTVCSDVQYYEQR